MKKLLITVLLLLITKLVPFAQCAMCRMTVESTVSNGRSQIASNLNTGILYLLVSPYLAVAVVGYLWWMKSKKGLSPRDIMRMNLKKAFK